MMIIMFRCLRFPYKPNFINNSIPNTETERERTIKCGHIRPSTQPPTHHCRSRKSAVYWVLWVNICFLLFLLHYHPVSSPTSSSSIHSFRILILVILISRVAVSFDMSSHNLYSLQYETLQYSSISCTLYRVCQKYVIIRR